MLEFENQLDRPEVCATGLLVMHKVCNLPSQAKLDQIKMDIAEGLRRQFGQMERKDLKNLHPLDIYTAYYKKFGYTYHLLLQMESILRGKPLTTVSTLVDAMFIAEMQNKLLTAGHDLDKICGSLSLRKAAGESYTALNGNLVNTVSGDILIADNRGVISSILRGPDARTSLDFQTSQAVFTVYAPAGIAEALVLKHLDDIESLVKVFSAQSTTALKKVYAAIPRS
jgi:DNA/RNA-binding domain of Phe-tRNA-synthetase-like protein